MKTQSFLKGIVLLLTLCGITYQAAAEVKLIHRKRSTYMIYGEKKTNATDLLAMQELQKHIYLVSDVRLRFSMGKFANKGKYLFVGMTPEARALLGRDCLYDSLKEEEHVVQVKGNHVFLYGKGTLGNLFAVYDFLEKDLGIRFLSPLGYTHIPKKNAITLKEGVRRTSFAFQIRSMSNFYYPVTGPLYFIRNRMNFRNMHGHLVHPGIVSCVSKNVPDCHALARYLPGFKGKYQKYNYLFRGQDYFKTHPEWFSMDQNGKRVPTRQACFSNKALRKQLAKNALIYHEYLKSNDSYGDTFLYMDLNDIAYNMCYCKECAALQKKYKTPGGPYFEFLFEFCKNNPQVEVIALAYQRSLTQCAPKGLGKAPKNLIVIFCPINGSFAGTYKGTNSLDYRQLKEWTAICSRVLVWYYPNTYQYSLSVPIAPPRSIFYRIASDVKAMHEAGVAGTFFEHNSGGTKYGANLTEMQTYILLKLFQDPYQNVDKLMEEFARLFYGNAHKEILVYARDLEKMRNISDRSGRIWSSSTNNFEYLTEYNLIRWSKLFDQAEKKVKGDHLLHVRLARTGLDCILIDTLKFNKKYKSLVNERIKGLTEAVKDARKRNHLTNHPIDVRVLKWLKQLENTPEPKAFPPEIAKYPKDLVHVVLPNRMVSRYVIAKDKDANLNFAVWENFNGKNYTWRMTSLNRREMKFVIPAKNIKMGRYAVYKLFNKPVQLTPDAFLRGEVFNRLIYQLGHLCPYDHPETFKQKWIPYASMKFTKNKVYIDRIFMVKAK